jgi:RNA polymerase sigma-70 factor (ECF subfamily)
MEASITDPVFDTAARENAGEGLEAEELGAILRRVAAGEAGALARLYDLCGARLFALALWRTGSREDAADVVQEVFVRLARTGRGLARVRRPLPYLLRMTHNLAVSTLRRRREHGDVDRLMVADPAADAEARFAARQAAALLARLPAKQREALYLRHFEGLTYREIAAVLGIPAFTAASRCRTGLAKLRRMMGVSR